MRFVEIVKNNAVFCRIRNSLRFWLASFSLVRGAFCSVRNVGSVVYDFVGEFIPAVSFLAVFFVEFWQSRISPVLYVFIEFFTVYGQPLVTKVRYKIVSEFSELLFVMVKNKIAVLQKSEYQFAFDFVILLWNEKQSGVTVNFLCNKIYCLFPC